MWGSSFFFCVHQLYLLGSPFFFCFASYNSGVRHSSSAFPAISLEFAILLLRSPAISLGFTTLLLRSRLYLWGSPFFFFCVRQLYLWGSPFFFFYVASYISGVRHSSSTFTIYICGVHHSSSAFLSHLHRLRTGHCQLLSHLRKLNISHSDECPCGTGPQPPNHILQSCPTFDDLRRQTWPSPVNAHRKLWGPVETLQQTADFALLTGLKI